MTASSRGVSSYRCLSRVNRAIERLARRSRDHARAFSGLITRSLTDNSAPRSFHSDDDRPSAAKRVRGANGGAERDRGANGGANGRANGAADPLARAQDVTAVPFDDLSNFDQTESDLAAGGATVHGTGGGGGRKPRPGLKQPPKKEKMSKEFEDPILARLAEMKTDVSACLAIIAKPIHLREGKNTTPRDLLIQVEAYKSEIAGMARYPHSTRHSLSSYLKEHWGEDGLTVPFVIYIQHFETISQNLNGDLRAWHSDASKGPLAINWNFPWAALGGPVEGNKFNELVLANVDFLPDVHNMGRSYMSEFSREIHEELRWLNAAGLNCLGAKNCRAIVGGGTELAGFLNYLATQAKAAVCRLDDATKAFIEPQSIDASDPVLYVRPFHAPRRPPP